MFKITRKSQAPEELELETGRIGRNLAQGPQGLLLEFLNLDGLTFTKGFYQMSFSLWKQTFKFGGLINLSVCIVRVVFILYGLSLSSLISDWTIRHIPQL